MLKHIAQALELAQPVAQMIPVVGGMIGAGIELCGKILALAEDAKALKTDFVKLADRAARITLAVTEIVKDVGPERMGFMERRIEDLLKTLRSCQAAAGRAATVGRFGRIFGTSKLRDELTHCSDLLEEAVVLFGIQSQLTHTNMLTELNDMAVHVEQRISDIAQGMSSMDQFVRAQGEYHEEFKYFRLCDLEILETFPLREGRRLGRVSHVVRRYGTQEHMVMKTYSPEDVTARSTVELLKSIRHANVEQRIGYSRPQSKMPFYVTCAGQQSFEELMCSRPYRERINLFINKHNSIAEAMWFLAGKMSIDGYAALSVFSMHISFSLGRPDVVFSPKINSCGKLVFEIPDSVEKTCIGHHDIRMFEGLQPLAYFDISNIGPFSVCGQGGLATWIRLLEMANIGYRAPLHHSLWYYPGRDAALLYTGQVVDGCYVLLCHEPTDGYDGMLHINYIDKAGNWKLAYTARSNYLPKDNPMASWHNRAFNDFDRLFSVEFRYASWTEYRPWASLVKDVLQLSNKLNVEPYSVCRGENIWDHCTWSFVNHDTGDIPYNETLPETLYFWPHVAVGNGPMPVENGYWSLDKEGLYTSSFVQCWHGDNSWCVEHDLQGLRLHMYRYARMEYVKFNREEIEMLRENAVEGNAWIEQLDVCITVSS